MNVMISREIHKVVIFVIKILPTIGCLVMCLHCLTLLLGKDWVFAESVFGLSVASALLLMLMSIEYRFCVMHKLQILYIISMQFCITFQREFGFGRFLTLARVVMFLVGVMILLKVLIHFRRYICTNPRRFKERKPRSEAEILQDIYDSLNSHKAFERKNMEHMEQIKQSIACALNETGIIEQLNDLRERMDDFEDENFEEKRGFSNKNTFRVYNKDIKWGVRR